MPLAQSEQQSVGVTAADLLAYDNRQLDQFLREHDILSLQGVLEISKAQRSQLARAIRARLDLHGGSPGSGQLDASELAARLTHVAGEPSRYPLDEPPRSPTESTEHTQSPADTQGYEDLCRQELVADGGHPIVGTAQELLQMCAQPKISCHAILAWLSDEPDTETGARELTTFFSRQLERWWDFRKSQWKHRAASNGDGGSGEEAFPAYLGAKTRIYERSGATRLVSSDSFKETIWRQWQTLRAFQQLPEKQSFSSYRDAVQMRIGRYQFKRGLQLKKDVHQQDSWTTLLEYLNYESWYWEQLTAKAELLEPAFFASRILLSGVETDSTSPTSNGRHFATKASSLDEKLAAAQADRDACRNMINAIRRAVRPYRKARYAAYRQRLRVDWVVELARTMETGMGQQGEGSITVGQSHGTGKRGCDDEPQPKKRAKQRVAAAHSASGANKTGLSMVTRQSARLAKRSSSRNPPRAEKSN